MPAKRKSTRKPPPAALYKAHRIALDPTDRQDTLFRQHCGFARVEDLQPVRGPEAGVVALGAHYRCVACGFECDRDANAARNIQAFHTAARSAVADAETRKTDRTSGPHGR